jgi:hypothetical protein
LPVCAVWSELLLFSPGGRCIALQLQLCLVSSSPTKVGQFSFECCPLSHFGSTTCPLWQVACLPTPALRLCACPDLWWVLVAPVEGWLVTPLLLSAFAALPAFVHWEFSSLPHPCSPGQVQCSTSTSAVSVRLRFDVCIFQFCWGDSVSPGAVLDYVPWVCESRWGSHVWCMMLTCLFCRLMQAVLELASREKWCHFSQCGMA